MGVTSVNIVVLKTSEPTTQPKGKRSKLKIAPSSKHERKLNYEKILKTCDKLKPKYLNLGLLISVLALSAFGLMMVFSASNYNAQIFHGNRFYYFNSQLIGVILGLVAITGTYLIDYRVYKRFYWLFLAGGGILLILVFIPGIGIERLGANRWIGIGGFSMQPSEVAKFCFIVFTAAIAAKAMPKQLTWKSTLLILLAGTSICALILLEPNLSITLCLGLTMFIMLYLCGARIKHLAIISAPALIALPVLLVAEPYRVRRLLAFIDPWAHPKDEGFQLIQSLFGLGNGGFFGVGFGNSTQKHTFLPFAESDFIFSIIGEEFGFVGTVLFLAVLGFMVYKIFKIGMQTEDFFGKFLCYGIATLIFVQSAVNIAVVTGSIPPTGVPLPFISFGGTSLAVYLAAIGVVLNIDKRNKIFRENSAKNGI